MSSMNPQLEGRTYWRSLAELASRSTGSDGGDEFVGYEPPTGEGPTRRQFLSIMAAAMGLAGLSLVGCRRWPEQDILPFTARPEGMSPGEAVWFASMLERDGVATGVLARCYDGRPIKLEGNPAHPGSLGALDAIAQSSILDLYDPDRIRAVLMRGPKDAKPHVGLWQQFDTHLRQRLAAIQPRGGEGLVVLTELTASPTMARLRTALQRSYPQAAWPSFAPLHRDCPPSRKRLERQEQTRHAVADVHMIEPLDIAWTHRQWLSCLANQLLEGLIHADHRPLWIIRPGVDVQHVFHVTDELRRLLGRDAPHLFQVRFELVFLGSAAPSRARRNRRA